MSLKVNVIGSSSSGNSIVVSDGVSSIMLDAGLPMSQIDRAVNVSELSALLLSHEHGDHSRSASALAQRGVEVITSLGTAKKVLRVGEATIFAKSKHQIDVPGWTILPFDVDHDAAEPLGFMVQSHNTNGCFVYAVDCATIKYDFENVTHWLIEVNYDEHLLEKSGRDEWLKDRVRKSHFSLYRAKMFFRSSDLSKTQEIHLLHLSDTTSDERRFIEEIQAVTGVPVFAAKKSFYSPKAEAAT